MADFALPTDLNSLYGIASGSGFGYWINLAIGMILSTVIGGIVLIVVLQIFNRIYGETTNPKNAFLVVLIANIINYFGIMGILLPYLYVVPYIGIILPLLIWILLMKVFFEDMSFLHVVIVGVVFYALTLLLIPMVVSMVAGFIPSF
jgi:hypothetical protein